MSWHTSAILIQRDFSQDIPGLLEDLGLEGAERADLVSLDDASSSSNEGVAVGTVDGWTALWGSIALFTIDDAALARLSRKTNVFQMILEGASGTAAFTWYQGGEAAREWLCQAGDMIKDYGEPLPAEAQAFAAGDDEQAVLSLLEKLTLPLERLEGIEYRMYEISDDYDPGDDY